MSGPPLPQFGTYRWLVPANRDQSFGGSMAIKFLQTPDGSDDSIDFHLIERLKVYLFGRSCCLPRLGWGKRSTDFCFQNLTARRIAFRSKLCSASFLPGWLLSSSGTLTETVRRGAHDL